MENEGKRVGDAALPKAVKERCVQQASRRLRGRAAARADMSRVPPEKPRQFAKMMSGRFSDLAGARPSTRPVL